MLSVPWFTTVRHLNLRALKLVGLLIINVLRWCSQRLPHERLSRHDSSAVRQYRG